MKTKPKDWRDRAKEKRLQIAREADNLSTLAWLLRDVMEVQDFDHVNHLRTIFVVIEERVKIIDRLEDELNEIEDGRENEPPFADKTLKDRGKLTLVGKNDHPPLGA